MHILITGGAGFIGSHVGSKLASMGHSIHVIDDFNDYYAPEIKRRNLAELVPGARLTEGDIRNRDAVEQALRPGIDLVVHLAARAGVRPSIHDPELYISTNINGTYQVLDAARQRGIGRFVFASSSSVYGVNDRIPFRETDLIQSTISPYAMTKLAGEQICSNFAHLYGMQVVCLRLFTVYGPGQRPDLAIHKFTELIHRGEEVPMFGDGSTERDYTYIDDIVQGIVAAVGYDSTPFEIFNLGESETTSLRNLIGEVERALGKTAKIRSLPEQPGDVPRTFADISKARRLLGYTPSTQIAEGVPRFVEWYLSRHA